MGEIIRKIRSVCPVCLKNLPAQLEEEPDGTVFLVKTCPEHGPFQVPVWRGKMDFRRWTQYADPLGESEGLHCPGNCGICPEHGSGSCCVLLEVTKRCNLRCRFCFADGGSTETEPSPDTLKQSIRDLVRQCGHPLLQLSGGEPTLRDDLPEIVKYAKEAGCSYVQVNTNGLRLARDPDFVNALARAGLDIVFLQFDGTEDRIYRILRGMPLLEIKQKAILACGNAGIGVTLVPTVVRGINDRNLGQIVRFAVDLVPAVRGIHFQPVSYFGRYPDFPDCTERYTLDELMQDLALQADLPPDCFQPSRCDHPLCGFHAGFLVNRDGSLRALSSIDHTVPGHGTARDNREYVARHWKRAPEEEKPACMTEDEMDFDTFLYRVRQESLTLSAMAFQDAGNLNIERLHRCTLHVFRDGRVMPFCAAYLTPMQ